MEQKPFLRNLDERAFNPMNDVAFKFIFGKEERKMVTIDFLNAVLEKSLGHEIKDITFRQSEMFPDGDEGKMSRLDIYCTQGCGHGARRDGEKPGKHCSDENTLGDEENFFMNRFRCKKLLLRLTEKPISMDSSKKVKFLAHGQSKKVWNPCNRTLVQGSESFRMDKAAMVHAS